MKKALLGGVIGTLALPLAGLMIFSAVIFPQMSTSEPPQSSTAAYCLPSTSGGTTVTPGAAGTPGPQAGTTPLATPIALPSAVPAGAGQTTAASSVCVGNKAVVQAAREIVAHLHGDPDTTWDAGMPQKAVDYWNSACPPGSGCWINWQSGMFQCVTLVTGAYALAGAPLPVAHNAFQFWADYANLPGWSEIPSYAAPAGTKRHLPLPGDIMVWWDPPPRVGHVAIVTDVVPPRNGQNGSITFAQANGPGSVINGQFVPGITTQILTPDLEVLTWSNPVEYRVYGFIRPNSVYVDLAAQYAIAAGIPPALFQQQIKVESGYNPNAVSPAGAIGIAQFMPATAAGLTPPLDPTDPVASLAAAAQYMASKTKQFGGDYKKALASYNAGDGAVNAAVAAHGDNWLQFMPSETFKYVQSITGGT